MVKQYLWKSLTFLSGCISSWIILLGTYPGGTTEASCAGLYHNGWYSSTSITYQTSGFGTVEIPEIQTGATEWSTANTTANCSNVTFATTGTVKLSIIASPNQHPTKRRAAATTEVTLSGLYLASATITF